MREDTLKYQIKQMAEMQLKRCIEDGKWTDLCKAEWKLRHGVEYPNTWNKSYRRITVK